MLLGRVTGGRLGCHAGTAAVSYPQLLEGDPPARGDTNRSTVTFPLAVGDEGARDDGGWLKSARAAALAPVAQSRAWRKFPLAGRSGVFARFGATRCRPDYLDHVVDPAGVFFPGVTGRVLGVEGPRLRTRVT